MDVNLTYIRPPLVHSQLGGRNSPEEQPFVFTAKWREKTFVIVLMASQIMTEYFVSGFAVLTPELTRDLRLSPQITTWPATAFSLSLCAFLFVFGNLADVYDPYYVFIFGFVWFAIVSLGAGFASNASTIIALRTLQGLGPAALLPAGTKMICSVYPQGKQRTFCLGLFGSGAALGLFLGILLAGVTAQYLTWRWFFWLGSLCLWGLAVASYFIMPRTTSRSQQPLNQTDWASLLVLISGLSLVVFGAAFNSFRSAGQIALKASTLAGGFILLALVLLMKSRVGDSLMQKSRMAIITLAQVFSYGAFGLFLFYSTLSFQNNSNIPPFQAAIWYLPFVVTGVMIGAIVQFLLHQFKGRDLLIVSGIGSVTSAILLIFRGSRGGYWEYVFPSMICASIGLDITFEVANVHMLGWVDSKHHGSVGAWINGLFNVSIAFFLGIASTILEATHGQTKEENYLPAYWLQLGSAILALCLAVFSALPRAPRE